MDVYTTIWLLCLNLLLLTAGGLGFHVDSRLSRATNREGSTVWRSTSECLKTISSSGDPIARLNAASQDCAGVQVPDLLELSLLAGYLVDVSSGEDGPAECAMTPVKQIQDVLQWLPTDDDHMTSMTTAALLLSAVASGTKYVDCEKEAETVVKNPDVLFLQEKAPQRLKRAAANETVTDASDDHEANHTDTEDHEANHTDTEDHEANHTDTEDHEANHTDTEDHEANHMDTEFHEAANHTDTEDHEANHTDTEDHEANNEAKHMDTETNDEQRVPEASWFVDAVFEHMNASSLQNMSVQAFTVMLAHLGIGGYAEHEEDNVDEDDHYDQKHAPIKKRSVEITHCFSASELLSVADDNGSSYGVSRKQFLTLCPALVQQQLSSACLEEHVEEEEDDHIPIPTALEKYGGGTVAVLLISLASLSGVVFLPCMDATVFRYVMGLFVALAVSTLASDALFHLIPTALGVHDSHAQDDKMHLEIEPFVYKGLALMAAIYLFFILETIMESTNMKAPCPQAQNDALNAGLTLDSDALNAGLGREKTTNQKIQPAGWIVVFGDAVHNFADGMAIGAAFSLSTQSGISTSLAVLCHELPHEFGDFAVMLNAGMPLKMALCMNFLSACTSFIGLYIGIVMSTHEGQLWIFTLAGGMFLYVALSDMIPELISMQKENEATWHWMFLMQNIGFLLGVGLMLLLSVFERYIKI